MNQKLKMKMVGNKRIQSREGGVEIVVEELSKRMVSAGHTVYAYNRKGNHVSGKEYGDTNSNLSEYEGIRIIQVPTIEAKGLTALYSSFFATIKAIFGKYDMIHFHAEGPCSMLWLPHLFGIRTVATIHGFLDVICHERNKCLKYGTFYSIASDKL